MCNNYDYNLLVHLVIRYINLYLLLIIDMLSIAIVVVTI